MIPSLDIKPTHVVGWNEKPLLAKRLSCQVGWIKINWCYVAAYLGNSAFLSWKNKELLCNIMLSVHLFSKQAEIPLTYCNTDSLTDSHNQETCVTRDMIHAPAKIPRERNHINSYLDWKVPCLAFRVSILAVNIAIISVSEVNKELLISRPFLKLQKWFRTFFNRERHLVFQNVWVNLAYQDAEKSQKTKWTCFAGHPVFTFHI